MEKSAEKNIPNYHINSSANIPFDLVFSGISTQHDLMRYFINSVARLASEAGMSIGAWEDAVLDETPYSRSDFQNK